MHVAKLGMNNFIARPSKDYFHLEDDCLFTVDFHDMHRLLRCKDLNVAKVILFALMQSYVCKELEKDIIYLSPMHITQRAIIEYVVPNMHPSLMDLDRMQRVEVRTKMQGEIKYRK